MAIVTLTPNADTVGGSYAAALADGSDASYVDVGPATGALTINFTTFALPVGALAVSITLRYRAAYMSSVVQATIWVNAAGGFWVPINQDTTAAAASYTYTFPAPLTQAQIDSLNCDLTWHGSASGTAQRYYFLAADLAYTLLPAVLAVSPSGPVTITAQPNAAWIYTPGSEGAQSHYQVRVFTTAQYSIPGFDPATSPATYDSGQAAGGITSVAIPGLKNNTTYRSYVRVAQIANAQPNWSPTWSSTDFSIAVATTAPAVTAPAGVIVTTTQPAVVWTYNGAYGPQSHYQVRVFTAAQYGIAGFDPAQSPAIYDSQVTIGPAVSLTVPLPNGAAYRAYVRTAQMVGADPQWSTYAFTAYSLAAVTSEISTVSATPDSVNGRNRITVVRNVATPYWGTVELQRSADGGVTWALVRGASAVIPPGDVWIGYDYEAGNGQPVVYRARATYSLGTPITGAWKQSIAAVSWSTPGVDWLKDLRQPTLSMRIVVEELPALQRDRPRGVFSVVGRADPVIITDVQHLATGTLTVLSVTDAEARRLEALLADDVLLFQVRPESRIGSRYLAIGDVTEVIAGNVDDPARHWQLPFVEVAAPADFAVTVPGLTWADIIALYPTWAAFIAAVPTWGDLI